MNKLHFLLIGVILLCISACSSKTAVAPFSRLPDPSSPPQESSEATAAMADSEGERGQAVHASLTLPLNTEIAALAQEDRRLYQDLGELARDHAELQVIIEAHGPATGSADNAMSRTQAQAERIKQDMAMRFGIDAERILAVGHGADHSIILTSGANRDLGPCIRLTVSGFLAPDSFAPALAAPPESGQETTLFTFWYSSGQAHTPSLAQEDQEALFTYLAAHPNAEILIQGHTDSVGNSRENLVLSLERAEAVRNMLMAVTSFPAERFTCVGYGEELPLTSHNDTYGHDLNRRVTVVARPEPSQHLSRTTGHGEARPLLMESSIRVSGFNIEPRVPRGDTSANSSCAVLCYHGIDMASEYSISSHAFAEHIDTLLATGHSIISIDRLAAYLRGEDSIPAKSVVITFDDGWKSGMIAFHILKQRNLPFTLFVCLDNLGAPDNNTILDQHDLVELMQYPGVTFANHSHDHSPRLAARPHADPAQNQAFIIQDIAASKARFQELFGHNTPYFAFPYGAYSDTYTSLLNQSGFSYLFTIHAGAVDRTSDPNRLPRFVVHDATATEVAGLLDDSPRGTAVAENEASGHLYVTTTPNEAQVRVIGRHESFQQGAALTGEYVIEVSRAGYATQVQRVYCPESMDTTVEVTLTPYATYTAMGR